MEISRPRVVGYIRVSTAEQADSGLGLDAQRHELTRMAEFLDYELVDVIADEGRTGANLKRPGIRKALRMIANREVDGLVVAKLDRLSRSTADSAQLFHWFQEAEARLVLLDFRMDTGSLEGSVVAGFMALMAEWERKVIASRTKASLAALRRQGKPISRPAVIDQPELAARVRRMRGRDLTMQEICDVLNREGVPTPRGGALWRPSSLQTVLGYQRPPRRRPRTTLPTVARRRRVSTR